MRAMGVVHTLLNLTVVCSVSAYAVCPLRDSAASAATSECHSSNDVHSRVE